MSRKNQSLLDKARGVEGVILEMPKLKNDRKVVDMVEYRRKSNDESD